MNKWIVITKPGACATLVGAFACPADELNVLAVGDRSVAEEAAQGTARVVWIDAAGGLPERYATGAAAILAEEDADVVFGIADPATRAILAKMGPHAGALASNVIRVDDAGSALTIERLTLSNQVVETDVAATPARLLFDPLSVDPDAAMQGAPASIEERIAEPDGAVALVSLEATEASDLETAERVVGIGRGVGDRAAFGLAQDLAAALGAKVGCTMPISTDTDFLPGQDYIGLSGLKVAPKLYVALGISGTVQHLAGLRNAKKIVVVNKDPKAKFFSHADYGIVGTVEEVVPSLIEALG